MTPLDPTPLRCVTVAVVLTLALGGAPTAATSLAAQEIVGAPPGGPAVSDEIEARRLVFALEYIGADYVNAVRDGHVVNAFEYDEMVRMVRSVIEGWPVLRRLGAPVDVELQLGMLEWRIHARQPETVVRSLATELVATLIAELGIFPLPARTPDVERGAGLYVAACAICHGPSGDGRGTAAPGMAPAATSFRDERMNAVSPHQIHGAISFGVLGTAMPSYREALSSQEIWDLSFFVLTLRDDFDPRTSDPPLPLTLEDVATRSASDLLAELRRTGRPATLPEIDALRATPPGPGFDVATLEGAPGATEAPAVEPPAGSASAGAFGVAVALQDAFATVAERTFPSVVGVHAYVRDATVTPPPEGTPAWQVAEALRYPGFRRLRSGSGFFVAEDGTLLTCHSVIAGPDGGLADVLSVELSDGQHVLARVVGAEPTVNLAVLELAVTPGPRALAVTPANLGTVEHLRVGHWTLGLGDPWGPGRSFAVGTLSTLPERQCYQEALTATLLQSALSVHPETQGGPLVDIHGRVVGMLVPAGMPSAPGPGGPTAFALPIDLAMNLALTLQVSRTSTSPWLGVSVLELAAVRHGRDRGSSAALPADGVYIDDVFDPSPASRSGVRVGDVLVSIDGNRLESVFDFQRWLYLSGIGREVDLEIFRDGEQIPLRATIEARPASATTR